MTLEEPRYHHPSAKVPGASLRRMSAGLLENLFFIASTGMCFATAVILIIQGVRHPVNILWFILFWALMAYLALPRLHRMLTAIYLPDYFIGRTRTSSGLLGDPVNLAFLGSEDDISVAMERAGWVRADPLNLRSAWRIVVSTMLRRSYPEAPVSALLLFGRQQAFAYQQEVEGNPLKRHHVRFWRSPDGWLLPGGHRVDWVAAGTYDRRVGISLFTLAVTHKIDRNTDVERDYIISTLEHASRETQVDIIEDFSTGYHCRNGGGDAIETDGNLPIVDVNAVCLDDGPQRPIEQGAGSRPIGILTGIVLSAISLLYSTAWTAFQYATGRLGEVTTVEFLLAISIPIVLIGGLLWPIWRGSQLARLALVALLTITTLGQLFSWFTGELPTARTLVISGADLLALYSLTSQTVREWTQRRSPNTTLGTGTYTLDPSHPEHGS